MGVALESLPSFVAGARVLPEASSARIRSLDGAHELPVAETSPASLRRALRFAEQSQARLRNIPLHDRLEAARLVVRDYERRSPEACWALAHFRGITLADARWMCQLNARWAENFDDLVAIMFDGGETRELWMRGRHVSQLSWHSRGAAALFSSSTMDGPAAVVALCHAMITGTHLILKPSFRDAATHLAFETLHAHGLHAYAQLVRWRSDAPDAAQLNRSLLAGVAQSVVFSSNETYRALIDDATPPRTPEWEALQMRTKRYGTGLPLGIVTANADLDAAARDLVEGARLGGGRFCLSAGPVLVERSHHDVLVERVVARARALRGGPLLAEGTDLSAHDRDTAAALRTVVRGFGGATAYGAIRDTDMDVIVLGDVPVSSTALYREVPGPVLALIPIEGLAAAEAIAAASLRQNGREAWTAVAVFGNEVEFVDVQARVAAYRYLRGGVVAQVNLLLPHQGAYFALDLVRRVSVEPSPEGAAIRGSSPHLGVA
ncbi:MAG: aldehyde dehydrogenase family protein [Polyangiales bacterium]